MSEIRPYQFSSTDDLEMVYRQERGRLDLVNKIIKELEQRVDSRAADGVLRFIIEDQKNLKVGQEVPTRPRDSAPKVESLETRRVEPQSMGQTVENQDSTRKTQSSGFDVKNHLTRRLAYKKKSLTRVRPRGSAPDAPDKLVFESRQTVILDVEGKDHHESLLEGLSALITDMQRRSNSSRRGIHLKQGSPYLDFGETMSYQFVAPLDIDIQEGMTVVGHLGKSRSTRVNGKILSVHKNVLVIRFERELQNTPSECEIVVDRTSLLRSLESRLQRIRDEKKTSFNKQLAIKALTLEEIRELDEQEAPKFKEQLNEVQKQAVKTALSKEVSYIWGPPGTGKTLALGELVRILYEQKRTILVCSNTNQAVDQLLLKLCQVLGKEHSAIQKGQLIRIGEIEHEILENEWGDQIKLDAIVEREGAKIIDAKDRLILQRDKLRDSISKEIEVSATFEQADKFENTLSRVENTVTQLEREITDGRSAVRISEKKLENECAAIRKYLKDAFDERRYLEAEGTKRKNALLSFLHRHQDAIQSDANRVKSKILRLKEKEKIAPEDAKSYLRELRDKAEQAERKANAAKRNIKTIKKELKVTELKLTGWDRKAVKTTIAGVTLKLKGIDREIDALDDRFGKLRQEISDKARIWGATLTKTFLNSDLFNKTDTVIVDEASTAFLPAVYFACGLAKRSVVISGDYLQLPPIIETKEKQILKEVGVDIFEKSGTQKLLEAQAKSKYITMLNTQYRMHADICSLIAQPFYKGRLDTGISSKPLLENSPPLFASPITIIDTSSLYPYENRDQSNSRYNLLHAAVLRNLLRYCKKEKYLTDPSHLGICTPYKAQAKVLSSIIASESLSELVRASTVHRFQGDEKHTIILDIPDGLGFKSVGIFLQADTTTEDGARLFNVAVSRAKETLVIIANLTELDAKLPNRAILRGLLDQAQVIGRVIDVKEIVALEPFQRNKEKAINSVVAAANDFDEGRLSSGEVTSSPDLGRKESTKNDGGDSAEGIDEASSFMEEAFTDTRTLVKYHAIERDRVLTLRNAEFQIGEIDKLLYRSAEFIEEFRSDVRNARKSVAIFSAFITERRVDSFKKIFQQKINEGVVIRCVVRPPGRNGSMSEKSTYNAIEALQNIGCIVDLRNSIHEKAIVIDDSIIWFGSLNPLSVGGGTDELMFRLQGEESALVLQSFLSLTSVRDPDLARGLAVKQENPLCKRCGGLTIHRRQGKISKFVCLTC